ncbi:hypothetical protein [Dactylosporangium sp. NPDC048998]|uniref:hypothetical protein n=1 Tax=Dactylosporangium sp. NPDC048998 TaxID=3363976 RepID=UPI00371354B6
MTPENPESADVRQGLLDLVVNLSSPQIFSGSDFALYLHVKNPFDRPVWIHRVVTNLPASVHQKLGDPPIIQRIAKDDAQPEGIPAKIAAISKLIDEKRAALRSLEKDGSDSDVSDHIIDLRSEITLLEEQRVGMTSEASSITVSLRDGSSANVRAGNRRVYVAARDGSMVTIEGSGEQGYVTLRGSLPEGSALMPGCEDAMTITLTTRRSPFFLPAEYRLNLIVHYSFEPPDSKPKIYSNTVPFTVAIRTAMLSVMLGSISGSIVGSIGRLLQQASGDLGSLDATSALVSLGLASILSMAAAVFSARKSETQSFVTIEDFWGGALVGFLIGYSGTAAFQDLTGVGSPSPA